MADACPCCGQALIGDYGMFVALEYNVAVVGDRAIHLSPKQAELLFVLRKAWPRKITKSDVVSKVWGANSETDEGTVRNTAYQVNKKLRGTGYVITLGGGRYRLEMSRANA